MEQEKGSGRNYTRYDSASNLRGSCVLSRRRLETYIAELSLAACHCPRRRPNKCRSIPGCLITLADPCGPSPAITFQWLRSRFSHQLSFVRAQFIDQGNCTNAIVVHVQTLSDTSVLAHRSQGLLDSRRTSELSKLTLPICLQNGSGRIRTCIPRLDAENFAN